MKQHFKTFALLLCIAVGMIFHGYFAPLNPVLPYLLFTMLFITFCKVNLKEMKINKSHIIMLLFQLTCGFGVYFILRHFDEVVAQGVMSCILAPTATAAVVVTGLLGASVTSVATYTLLTNIAISIFCPILFSFTNSYDLATFARSSLNIMMHVFPVIVLPMIVSIVLKFVSPKAAEFVGQRKSLSFYVWILTVTIVMARTTEFVINQNVDNYLVEIILAASALVICVVNFMLGRKTGSLVGDAETGGQSLGQKNTALMIWLVQSYLNPVASVACAAYVVWQNVGNSLQLYQHQKKISKKIS